MEKNKKAGKLRFFSILYCFRGLWAAAGKEIFCMELKKLLEGVPCELIQGNANQEITNIAYDSRAVERGGCLSV